MAAATAIVPVKRLEGAKQRLASGLGAGSRRSLMLAMLSDTLEATAEARLLQRVLVVTSDRRAAEVAAAAGAEVVPDEPEAGHSQAAMHGIEVAFGAGASAAKTAILLPADCPLLDPREVDSLLTGHPSPFVTVVSDRHGTGTNALVLAPPDAIAPSFGEGSCERHVAAARRGGVPCAVEQVPSLALDLDTPADLVALARELPGAGRGRGRHTAQELGL